MRVEIADHAAYRVVDEYGVVDGFDVVSLDPFHYLCEQARLIGGPVLGPGACLRHHGTAEGQAEAHDGADYDDQNYSGFQ